MNNIYERNLNMDTQNPVSQPISQQPIEIKKKSKLPIMFLFLVLLLGGFFAYTFFTFQNEKKIILDNTNDQIENFNDLEERYNDVVNLLKSSNSSQVGQKEIVLGDNTESNDLYDSLSEDAKDVLGIKDVRESTNPIAQEVLGLEDTKAIMDSREFIEMMRNSIKIVKDISDENESIDSSMQTFSMGILGSSLNPPYKDTKDFAEKSDALLNFMAEVESVKIKMITWGFEIGNAINESILREADEQSVKKVEDLLAQSQDMKKEASSVNTELIPAELKLEHQESIDTFDNSLTIFYDVVDALKVKDADALSKAIISLISEGSIQAEKGTTYYVSFWQDNETLRSVSDVKEMWEEFQEKL